MKPITIDLTMADGKTETVTFRGIPLKFFDRAAQAHAARDEFALIGLSCDRTADWALGLAPESLAPAAAAMQQVNPAFFSWLGRRRVMEMGPEELLRMRRYMAADLPPETGGIPAGALGQENGSLSVVT